MKNLGEANGRRRPACRRCASRQGGIRPRQMLASNAELARKLDTLEKEHGRQFKIVFNAIRQLMSPPPEPKRREIGFHVKYDDDKPKAKRR